MNLANLRENYLKGGIKVTDMNLDPIEQFKEWMNAAIDAGVMEPNAMILATANKHGHVSTRTVLLKELEEGQFRFFTNYRSRKGRDIKENHHASVTFLWKELERQICIRGTVEKTSRQVSEKYFQSRPYQSQIGAWVSEEQSQEIPVRAALEIREQKLLEKYPEDKKVPCPEFWGGYKLAPSHIEFWQGREGRIHDRIRYRRDAGPWLIERLSP